MTIAGNGRAATGFKLVLGTASFVVVGAMTATAAEAPRVHLGAPVKVGEGTARVRVVEDSAGKPASIGVIISETALKGLPQGHAGAHDGVIYELAMPKSGPKTGYDHVTLDWNPTGHPPKDIYTSAHFDVHFYLIDVKTRDAISFKDGQAAAAAKVGASLVPAGYVVPPDTAVEKMGVHGVDPSGPEFKGKPFTATFIYGYHKGETIFVEPMVATAFLETKPDVTMTVRTPKEYSRPGYYPSRYRVAYDAGAKAYVVAMGGLRDWRMDAVPMAATLPTAAR